MASVRTAMYSFYSIGYTWGICGALDWSRVSTIQAIPCRRTHSYLSQDGENAAMPSDREGSSIYYSVDSARSEACSAPPRSPGNDSVQTPRDPRTAAEIGALRVEQEQEIADATYATSNELHLVRQNLGGIPILSKHGVLTHRRVTHDFSTRQLP